ncbi:MAG TPA: cyclase family protein [Streptosporangiaceae bacterium]|nr:cyclase family protein [Streptosporangiaceae bacterium]
MIESLRDDLPDWIVTLAKSRPFGEGDRRGTVNLIDAAARARAAACIRTGDSVSLARPLRGDDYNSTAARPGFRHETWYVAAPDGTGWGQDHLVLKSHGLRNTHVDALNHVAVDGTYYGGRPVDGADIEAALAAAGLVLERGDALCLDMGRDRFEAAAGHMLGGPETDQDAGGGLSSDGARWVAEHGVSVLAWDMLDSRAAKAAHVSAHILTWAIGLLLLDNCDFAGLRGALGGGTRVAGALLVSLLAVEGANGVNVNPLVLR